MKHGVDGQVLQMPTHCGLNLAWVDVCTILSAQAARAALLCWRGELGHTDKDGVGASPPAAEVLPPAGLCHAGTNPEECDADPRGQCSTTRKSDDPPASRLIR